MTRKEITEFLDVLHDQAIDSRDQAARILEQVATFRRMYRSQQAEIDTLMESAWVPDDEGEEE